MKKFFVFLLVLFVIAGCNKDDNNPIDNNNTIGGGGTNINIQITHQVVQDTAWFAFKADADVYMTKIRVENAQQQINYEVQNPAPNDLLTKNNWYYFDYGNPAYLISGQVWKFTLNGKNAQQAEFTKVVNYTIP